MGLLHEAESVQLIAAARNPEERLTNGSPLSLWQLHERLEMVCRLAGLRRIRWHDLRHSFASQLADGVPLRQVQAWLNHSTIHMSMRYAHLAPDAGAELISVLDRAPRGNDVGTK